jgi:UDP-N-acetylmuramate dehydrogenase
MFKKNISLAPYTTFKIGGAAKYFYTVKSIEDLTGAVKLAKKEGLPFFILGNGSNVLVSDKGFDGVVIKIENCKLKIVNCKITVDAGVLLTKLVNESVKAGLTGLEWAAGIPGTIGGAIRGNAGALGSSMADLIKTVEVFDITNLKIQTFENKDCKFGYRDSVFKHNKNLIIFSAELELKKGDRKKSEKLIKEYLKQRKEKQPLEYPSAGSIFKNPNGRAAGYLIEQCGLKGKKIGKAMISEKHANFIVNLGNAKAKDVKKLIDLCKEKVKEKFGIELEEEIEYLGEF